MIAAAAIFVSEGLLGVVAAAAAAAATSAGTATAAGADYSAMTSHLYLMPRKNVWKNHLLMISLRALEDPQLYWKKSCPYY